MFNHAFNEITETFKVKHRDRLNIFEHIANNVKERDFVFLCGDEKLSYHSEIISTVFPMFRNLVKDSKGSPFSFYLPKDAVIQVTMDSIDPKVLSLIMNSVYGSQNIKVSQSSLSEIRSILRMLGVDESYLVAEKIKSCSNEGELLKNLESSNPLTFQMNEIGGKRKFTDEQESAEHSSKRRVIDLNIRNDVDTRLNSKSIDEVNNASLTANGDSIVVPDAGEKVNFVVQASLPTQYPSSDQEEINIKESQLISNDAASTSSLDQGEHSADENPIKSESLVKASLESNIEKSVHGWLCPMPAQKCTFENRVFNTKQELLSHLSLAHFVDEILEKYPFTKGQPCSICVEQKQEKVLVAQARNRYVAHIGVNHEVVVSLLPPEMKMTGDTTQTEFKSEVQLDNSGMLNASVTLDEAPASAVDQLSSESDPNKYNSTYSAVQTNDHNSLSSQNISQFNSQSQHQLSNNAPLLGSEGSFNSYGYSASKELPTVQVKEEPSDVSKQESNMLVKQEPSVVIKQEPGEEAGIIYNCTLCTARSFNKRADLLFHLSMSHFFRNILQMYPFTESQMCPLCNNVKLINMSSHISHIGIKHEEVIRFLPADLVSILSPGPNSVQPQHTNSVAVTPVLLPPSAPPVEIKAGNQQSTEETSVQCNMCKANNKVRLFSKRSEFLKHLSLLHYGKALLQAFPFTEGKNCGLCYETSKKEYTPSKKEVHVCHVGVLHAKIFELLPKEILQQVMEMPTMKKINADQAHKRLDDQGASSNMPSISAPLINGIYMPPPTPGGNPKNVNSVPFTPLTPRDVVFKMPSSIMPSKEEFKLPMSKTDKPFNCRYCVSGFDVAKDLKDHLLTHKSQFSQISQTPKKPGVNSLVNLRMNTPRK